MLLRTIALVATMTLGACAPQPVPIADRPAVAKPHRPHQQPAAERPRSCPQYNEILEAIENARDQGGDPAALERARRTALAACNPRNTRARRQAGEALRALREIDDQ